MICNRVGTLPSDGLECNLPNAVSTADKPPNRSCGDKHSNSYQQDFGRGLHSARSSGLTSRLRHAGPLTFDCKLERRPGVASSRLDHVISISLQASVTMTRSVS